MSVMCVSNETVTASGLASKMACRVLDGQDLHCWHKVRTLMAITDPLQHDVRD